MAFKIQVQITITNLHVMVTNLVESSLYDQKDQEPS